MCGAECRGRPALVPSAPVLLLDMGSQWPGQTPTGSKQRKPHSESRPSSTLVRRSWVRTGEGGRAGHWWPGPPPAPVSRPRGPAGQVLAPARRPLALEV